MTRTLAQELAARIVAMRYEALPQDAIRWSKVAFMDTIVEALASARELTGAMQPLAQAAA
jgi:hypothetical protein